MKQAIFFAGIIMLALNAYSQTDSTKTKVLSKDKSKAVLNTNNSGFVKDQQQRRSGTTSPAQLPDMKITSFNVRYVSSQVINGIMKHTLEISYTVKNEGTVSLPASSVALQGWIGYETAYPKIILGCGQALSTIASEILNPGASYTGSFMCTAQFDKNNHPIYTLYLDETNTVKELNEQNNTAQMTILF